jgi:hypothetical protein
MTSKKAVMGVLYGRAGICDLRFAIYTETPMATDSRQHLARLCALLSEGDRLAWADVSAGAPAEAVPGLAREHKLEMLLGRALREEQDPAAGPLIIRYYANVAEQQRRREQIKALLPILAGRSIQAALVKGGHLENFVFSAPGMRSMRDIDLWLPDGRLEEARDILAAAGYRPIPELAHADMDHWMDLTGHLPPMVIDGGAAVELHRDLYPLEWRIDERPMAARMRTVDMDGVPVRAPDPADALIYQAGHLSKHAGLAWTGHIECRAGDVADLLYLARALPADWTLEKAAERAAAEGLAGPFLEGLALAERWFGLAVPPEAARRLRRASQPFAGRARARLLTCFGARNYDRRLVVWRLLSLPRPARAVWKYLFGISPSATRTIYHVEPGTWRYSFARLLHPFRRIWRLLKGH